jgi:hypothetical protein
VAWSEWQTGPTRIASFSKYTGAALTFGGDFDNGWLTRPSDIVELYATTLDLGDAETENPYGPVETRESATYYVVGDGWKTTRDWFPVALDSLEEGVDYSVRPDRTDDDDDAYVEYESDGDNTVTEEFAPLLRFQSGGVGGGDGGTPGDGLWELGYAADPTLPEQESDGSEFSVESWPPIGTVFASGGVEAVNTSHSAEFPTGFSTASTLRVAVRMPGTPPRLDDPGGEGSVAAQHVQFTLGAPSFRYQMPRWRYWIPGDIPLRQFPRNDGLRGGAPSARPTSQQSTTARRTYI